MSRSHRRHPIVVIAGGLRGYGKRLANRRLRHFKDEHVPTGGWWRRLFDSWDIVDLKRYWEEPDKEAYPEEWLRWKKAMGK